MYTIINTGTIYLGNVEIKADKVIIDQVKQKTEKKANPLWELTRYLLGRKP